MACLTDEELNKLMRYAKENVRISVPMIQMEFDWNYSKARGSVQKLVDTELLKYDEGIFYTYVIKQEKQPKDEDEEEDPFKGSDSLSKFFRDRVAPLDIKKEEEIIGNCLKMRNALQTSADKNKKTEDNYRPKNTKLPDSYDKLPRGAQELATFVIKNAMKRHDAKFGLFKGSKRWSNSSRGYLLYECAMDFIDSITDAEFKRIKYILTNC